MEKFFESLKYHSINFFAYLLIGISYILVSYPAWSILFFQSMEAKTYGISIVIGYPLFIVGEVIKNHNEDTYNEYKNKKD